MSLCPDYKSWPIDVVIKTRECEWFDGETCEKNRTCGQDWPTKRGFGVMPDDYQEAKEISRLLDENADLRRQVNVKQAEIDRLNRVIDSIENLCTTWMEK